MKPIKISAMALGFGFAVFLAAVVYEKYDKKEQIVGGYTFANVYGKETQDMTVVLNDGENTYTFKNAGGQWMLEEEDMYQAAVKKLNPLFLSFNNSRIFNYAQTGQEDFEFIPEWTIRLFYKGEETDKVAVKKDVEGIYLAKIGDNDKIYEISGEFDFPHKSGEWLQQPIFAVENEYIKELKVGERTFEKSEDEVSFDVVAVDEKFFLSNILWQLSDFRAEHTRRVENLNLKHEFDVRVILYVGLIYDLSFSSDGDKHYVTISMETTGMPLQGVKEFIEENKSLYEGWAFEISDERYKAFSNVR